MAALMLAFFESAWVQKVLFPALSYIFLKYEEKYRTDPNFEASVDGASSLLKTSQTPEDRKNAAKAFQDALFR